MTAPLDAARLDEIAARAQLAYDGGDPIQTAGYDVPDLLAEIRRLRGERDGLRERIGNARAEIARQDVRASDAMRPGFSDVCDALAAVETHLVDPEYRPAPVVQSGPTGGAA